MILSACIAPILLVLGPSAHKFEQHACCQGNMTRAWAVRAQKPRVYFTIGSEAKSRITVPSVCQAQWFKPGDQAKMWSKLGQKSGDEESNMQDEVSRRAKARQEQGKDSEPGGPALEWEYGSQEQRSTTGITRSIVEGTRPCRKWKGFIPLPLGPCGSYWSPWVIWSPMGNLVGVLKLSWL